MSDRRNPEQLPEIAERTLAGLTAGPELKRRIRRAAERPERRMSFRPVPVLAACAAVLVLAVALMGGLTDHAGQKAVTMVAAGSGNESVLTADTTLHGGDVTGGSSARSLWAASEGSTFPLISDHGRVYRMLASPAPVPSSLLGGSIGTIETVTDEPALTSGDTLMSNTAALGETVYAISGMDGTLVACEVNGTLRLFQRYSFNGTALQGGESLGSTLQISGRVSSMTLSSTGTVSDSETVNSLVSTLLGSAVYESAGQVSGSDTLVITLDNGLQLVLAVNGSRFSACGTWSCPAFFEAFAAVAS